MIKSVERHQLHTLISNLKGSEETIQILKPRFSSSVRESVILFDLEHSAELLVRDAELMLDGKFENLIPSDVEHLLAHGNSVVSKCYELQQRA